MAMAESKAGGGCRHGSEEESGSLFRMSENSLNLCLMGAVAGGMTLGWHIRNHGVSGRLLQLMDFPGELYMRMLECLAMPVVTSSIVAGLGSVDILLAGHIGLVAMLYFVLITVMASAIGIGVAMVLGPEQEACWRRQRLTQVDGFLDLLRNLVPDNYLEACVHTTVTIGENSTDEVPFMVVSESRANVLGLLSVSVMLGAVLSVTVSESDALLNLFVGLSNATVTVSHLTAWFSPLGVFFLVATRLTQLQDLDRAYGVARSFFHVTLIGLAAYGLGLLPALYVLATRQDPRGFLRFTLAPAMKAFRSASRTVSVPDTIEALEDLACLEPRIVRFVIPVGANVSMSGTALVAAATAVVLAHLDGLDVGIEELLIIGTTVVLASLGAASIPNSSVLTVLMILMALQVSSRDISLVFALDCVVDRFRTTVNIFSDAVGSAIVQQFSSLKPLEDSQDDSDDEPAPAQKPKNETQTSPVAQTEDEPRFESTEDEYQPLRTSKPQPRPAQRASGSRSQSPPGWRHERYMPTPKDAASVASTSSAAPSMTQTSAAGAPPTAEGSVEAARHQRAGVTPPASRIRKRQPRSAAAAADSSASEEGEAPAQGQRQPSEPAPVHITTGGGGVMDEMAGPGQSPRRRRRHKSPRSPRSPKAKKQASDQRSGTPKPPRSGRRGRRAPAEAADNPEASPVGRRRKPESTAPLPTSHDRPSD